MASKATQERISGLQSQLADAQRLAKLYSMPYLAANGKTPVESAAGAGTDKAGKPLGNPDYLPSSATMYLQEAGRIQTALTSAQQAAESEDTPGTTVHSGPGNSVVAVTSTKSPDGAPASAQTLVPDTSHQIANIPGVGVGVVDKDGHFSMVWQNQGLTPSEKVSAAYQGYGAYATWLNAQTSAQQMDETKRKNLWDQAHQQYLDELEPLKMQQTQNQQDEVGRRDAANYDSTNTATAAKFANDMATLDLNTAKDQVGPDFGSDFAGNFSRIGANPGGGQSNIQFNPGDFTSTRPDPVALGQQQFAQFMAHISPFAKLQVAGGGPTQFPTAPVIPPLGTGATAPTGGPQSVSLAGAQPTDPLAGVPYEGPH